MSAIARRQVGCSSLTPWSCAGSPTARSLPPPGPRPPAQGTRSAVWPTSLPLATLRPGTSVRGRGRGCVRARRRVPLRIPVRDLPDTSHTDLDLPPSPRIVDLELPPRADQAPRPINTPCHQADTRSSVQSTYPGIFREASCGTRAPTPCRMLSKLHAKRQSPPYLRSGGSKKASPGGLRRRCHPWSL